MLPDFLVFPCLTEGVHGKVQSREMMDQFTECHNRYTRGYLDWGAERRLHLQNNGNVKRNMMNVFCKVSNPATSCTVVLRINGTLAVFHCKWPFSEGRTQAKQLNIM